MGFRIGERVKHRKFVGTVVEIDDISARVFVEEQGNTCWVEFDELASIDALQADLAAALARAEKAEAMVVRYHKSLLNKRQLIQKLRGWAKERSAEIE